MTNSTPRVTCLKDYRKPDYRIATTELDFRIFDAYTRVRSKLLVKADYADAAIRPLSLHGERLKLISVAVDGRPLAAADYELTPESLSFFPAGKDFLLEIETEIEPQNNKALEGLYQSGSIFCTQNEPEGFRKITYFLDRSDVMSVYTTRIEADKKRFPILLANGNPVARGDLEHGRHFVVWNDPFKKPSYLFALVAGDLAVVKDSFTTRSGRKIALEIYVDHGNEDRSQHALDSLKLAMKWDEEAYGREYDLDIFMIVAVDAFNFGAMENKGLNIFNSTAALANTRTATDANFQGVEATVAHEYFHNWSGNRVTCRDWFQLTLKEGFTVFRDQQFSSDVGSPAVRRIDEVGVLRNSQFTEDSGPVAHPIKPASYIEINNFYTATVYDKGAEVIRMIQTMIGKERFRKGSDTYFELYDGQAVTTEDFVHAMELASGRDFTQFKNWYCQAGTPRLDISSSYDAARQSFALTVKQWCPATPADTGEKQPFHLPLVIGLLDAQGRDLPIGPKGETSLVLEVTRQEETFTFAGIAAKPLPSLLRHFSAPVIVNYDYRKEELAFLFAHDSDPFNRYEAGQRLATIEIEAILADLQAGRAPRIDPVVSAAFGKFLADPGIDDGYKAIGLSLPTVGQLVERQEICDFGNTFAARETLGTALAADHEATLQEIYRRCSGKAAYALDNASIGRRSLRAAVLGYLALLPKRLAAELATAQCRDADNMTDTMNALGTLAQIEAPETAEALADFYAKWRNDPLVMNKWFALQSGSKLPGTTGRLAKLAQDPAFDAFNPNKIRALWGIFAGNVVHFHAADGSGYRTVADQVIRINSFNPSAAAGLAKGFRKYARMPAGQKNLMKLELERMLATPDLSKDVFEIVSKTLEQGK
jgi:aminopeptidase N